MNSKVRVGVAAAVVIAIVPAAALGVTGDFNLPATSPEAAGDLPFSIAAANLGGDANVDLAVANQQSNNVTILIGDGTGNFTAPVTSPEAVGDFPQSVVAADLGGTASMDLAVANKVSDNVSILLGDGSGNFTPAGTSPEPAGTFPQGLAVGNLNGDANNDLVAVNYLIHFSPNVRIMLGDGTGDFSSPVTSPEQAGDFPRSVAIANLDGSAGADLAIANSDAGSVEILLGDGDGNFTPLGTETTGDFPNSVVAAKLGGDSNVDLAVANTGDGNVTILLGDGGGSFSPAVTSPEAAGVGANAVVAADLAGDANNDLAVANHGSDDVTILIGDGTGNFTALSTSPESAGTGPRSIAAANLGGNASTDLAVANGDADNVTILLNDFIPPLTPIGEPTNKKKKCKHKGKRGKRGKCGKKKRKKKKK